MAVHKRTCGRTKALTYEQICNQLTTCKNLVQEKDTQLQLKDYKIENLELQIKHLNTQLLCKPNVVNNSTTNNIHLNVNHYYVLDSNGLREGLDMSKLRSFGDENVDYIDKTKPLPTILKEIYCNSEHPENRVLSHNYLNLQWMLFKCKDHILSLDLEHDRDKAFVMQRMVCDNVERLLGRKFENEDERMHAGRELLQTMDNEVRELEKTHGVKRAFKMLPLWNKGQFDSMEERVWRQYMDDPNYSQNTIE